MDLRLGPQPADTKLGQYAIGYRQKENIKLKKILHRNLFPSQERSTGRPSGGTKKWQNLDLGVGLQFLGLQECDHFINTLLNTTGYRHRADPNFVGHFFAREPLQENKFNGGAGFVL